MHLRFVFCNDFAIEYKFSSSITPHQNGVVKRKDRSIQKMVKTTLIRYHLNNTLYELWKYRKPNINYCKVFGCKCYILNTKDNLGKFDPKFDVDIFLGYSNTSKTY